MFSCDWIYLWVRNLVIFIGEIHVPKYFVFVVIYRKRVQNLSVKFYQRVKDKIVKLRINTSKIYLFHSIEWGYPLYYSPQNIRNPDVGLIRWENRDEETVCMA